MSALRLAEMLVLVCRLHGVSVITSRKGKLQSECNFKCIQIDKKFPDKELRAKKQNYGMVENVWYCKLLLVSQWVTTFGSAVTVTFKNCKEHTNLVI